MLSPEPSLPLPCPQTPVPLPLEPDRPELLRHLGYRSTQRQPRPLPQATEDLLAEAQSRLSARGVFAIYDVETPSARTMTLADVTISGAVSMFLRGATRVVVFLVTAGDEVSRMSQSAAGAGDLLGAWALDALGSWAAEAAAEALMRRLAFLLEPHEVFTLRYSPGYCGMDLAQQAALFRLVRGDLIGVTLSPLHLMMPLKSISGLVGIGPEEMLGRRRSSCSSCHDLRCPIRRPEPA